MDLLDQQVSSYLSGLSFRGRIVLAAVAAGALLKTLKVSSGGCQYRSASCQFGGCEYGVEEVWESLAVLNLLL